MSRATTPSVAVLGLTRRFVTVLIALVGSSGLVQRSAHAQTITPVTPASQRANATTPLDAAVPVPAPVHRSVFEGYQRDADPARTSWRVANDTVNAVGGWRAYAREAAQSADSAPQPSPKQPAGPARHGTH